MLTELAKVYKLYFQSVELLCCSAWIWAAAEVLTEILQKVELKIGVWVIDEPAHEDASGKGQETVEVIKEVGQL